MRMQNKVYIVVYIWYGMRMNDEIRYDDKMHILQEYKLPYILWATHTQIHTFVRIGA